MNNVKLYEGSNLTVGGEHDPLIDKLIQAINHATEIEISVSFIQPSGLNLLIDALTDALENETSIKILTSDYLCITSPIALRRLRLLQNHGATIRIFECKKNIGFHMKSYIFINKHENEIIEGCAWVGSNNISRSALTVAHEWCLRHDFEENKQPDSRDEFSNICEQFTKIFTHELSKHLNDKWIHDYIIRYEKSQVAKILSTVSNEFSLEKNEPITPNSTQEQALTALSNSRIEGYKRGLVVLATGMGKTWLAAFDVAQMRAKRVLFVAHREEILLQAEDTFSQHFPQSNTGLYNAKIKKTDVNLLFASIQTIGKIDHLERFSPDFFDYVVIDEFHHASAPTYKNLLAYFQPKFMLGLTATPDRSDQADILSLCDNNLIFERNLVHGIDDKILVPFHYHGIYDEFVNYEEIPWRNGRFDANSLDNAFATKKRTEHIYKHWKEKKQTRTLAFCVSVKHANHMAKTFVTKGLKAVAVFNGSQTRRNEALSNLSAGKLDIIFSVDLFNEGTDLPSIDTILMLRPTESKILFLQQLGRGLRQSKQTNKTKLTVIDFIGNHRSFLNKPGSLLNASTNKEIVKKIQQGFTVSPNCYINYDPELVKFWEALAKQQRASAIEDYLELKTILNRKPTATEFYHHGYDLRKMRKQETSWFAMIAKEEKNNSLIKIIDKYGNFLLNAIETTSMTKCFKVILLEAFLELNGFEHPPTTKELAERSWRVLNRRPDLKQLELKAEFQIQPENSSSWHSYWKQNPINAFTKASKNNSHTWFKIEDGFFKANFKVEEKDKNRLHKHMQELVDFRLAEYIVRLKKPKLSKQEKIQKITTQIQEKELRKTKGTKLPFYPNLKIACGHFKTSSHDDAIMKLIPDGYGKLDPIRHFVAPAFGNSMNGGKNAIKDGDLLLLEWVTPDSAGSISNLTMAVEIQDDSGDNQYLLRVVKKQSTGHYLLQAKNSDFNDIKATDQMRTFARLKSIII